MCIYIKDGLIVQTLAEWLGGDEAPVVGLCTDWGTMYVHSSFRKESIAGCACDVCSPARPNFRSETWLLPNQLNSPPESRAARPSVMSAEKQAGLWLGVWMPQPAAA